MRKFFVSLAVMAATMFTVGTALAHVPKIQVLVLDASSSISEEDFNKEKVAAVKLIYAYHERAKLYEGRRADWVAVTFFGGDDDFGATEFVKCDDTASVLALMETVASYRHPKYGSTAIYTAVLKATLLCGQKDRTLPGTYMKNLIVVTDGADNGTNKEARRLVDKLFPNPAFNLFVVGVGGDAQVASFRGVADQILPVKDFDALLAALLLIGEVAH